ncbi:MAG: YIP1 family protein [Mariniphaga sp.]|nr:YIP1 family protein [Mariniphaga sp.]
MIKNIFNTIRELIFSPVKFWLGQKNRQQGQWQLLGGYYFLLVIITAIAVFIGAWFNSAHFYIGFALLKSLREILLFTLLYFISIFLFNQLIPAYGGEKNLQAVRKLVVYSLTPYLLISVISGLFPALYIINIAGLYGVYIFWIGVRVLLNIPERKQPGFILISVLLCLFVFGILSVLLWKIFVAYY